MRIVLGITGSVATTVVPKLVQQLTDAGHEIRIVATTPALYFLPEGTGEYIGVKGEPSEMTAIQVFRDKDEWPASGYHKNDPVRHIEFREWAELLLIAPLTANTLAKIANGICDNFLCCIARAWPKERPFVVAPAMNTEMWEDPITGEHISLLQNGRYKTFWMIEPIEGKLACGDTGVGAMARIEEIVKTVNGFKKE